MAHWLKPISHRQGWPRPWLALVALTFVLMLYGVIGWGWWEKTSTRTRCAFEVAAHDQGAHVTYLDPSGSQFGHKLGMGGVSKSRVSRLSGEIDERVAASSTGRWKATGPVSGSTPPT